MSAPLHLSRQRNVEKVGSDPGPRGVHAELGVFGRHPGYRLLDGGPGQGPGWVLNRQCDLVLVQPVEGLLCGLYRCGQLCGLWGSEDGEMWFEY